jgi:hypothetical protein
MKSEGFEELENVEKLSFLERQLEKATSKLGTYGWFNAYSRAVDNFMDNNIGTYTKICEIGGSGVAGFGLGKLMYASTTEEIINGGVCLIAGASVAIASGLVDLVELKVGEYRQLSR